MQICSAVIISPASTPFPCAFMSSLERTWPSCVPDARKVHGTVLLTIVCHSSKGHCAVCLIKTQPAQAVTFYEWYLLILL